MTVDPTPHGQAPPTDALSAEQLPREGARVFTGTRPTGPWHIGHLWGVLTNMVKLQERYDCFYCIVDYHALTTAFAHPEMVQGNIREIALDWLAGGIDPERSTMFVQSHVPEVAEFALLLSMVTPTAWLERNPTYKETLENNTAAEANAGLFTYPVLQTADICLYKGELVPIGKDQAAHLHLSQDIAKTFQRVYKRTVFPIPDYLFSEFPTVPGTDNRKMSKSYGNDILIRESAEATTAKVMKMYTDPLKQRLGDPGRPEICPVFYYHKMVSSIEKVEEVRGGCSSGALGCVTCKGWMAEHLNANLAPIRARRTALESDPAKVDALLAKGAEKARAVAKATIKEVRQVMGLEPGYYITDGGDHIPPARQFHSSDPEFQGEPHRFLAVVPGYTAEQMTAWLATQGFVVEELLRTAGGFLLRLVSTKPGLKVSGLEPQQYAEEYRVALSPIPDNYTFLDTPQGLSPKLIAGGIPQPAEDEVVVRFFGKRMSPSDLRVLTARIEELSGGSRVSIASTEAPLG